MPDDIPPAVRRLADEIRAVCVEGIQHPIEWRFLDLPSLDEQAAIYDPDSAREDATERLLRAAIERMGPSRSGERKAAEIVLGLPANVYEKGFVRRCGLAAEYWPYVRKPSDPRQTPHPDHFRKNMVPTEVCPLIATWVLQVAGEAEAARNPVEPGRQLRVLDPAWPLERQSDRLAADLGIVSKKPDGSGVLRLSDGLYIEREQEGQILDLLADRAQIHHVLLKGAAGYGKSSLLASVYRKLRERQGYAPLLLSGEWFLSRAGEPATHTVEEVMETVDHLAAAQWTPVVLLDTTDLLLHDPVSRDRVLDLVDRLRLAQARLVISTRPEEADYLLSLAFVDVFELGTYTDQETIESTAALARAYLSDLEIPAAKDGAEWAMEQRSPVEAVLRVPLLARLLFETAAPDFPSVWVTPTTVYAAYWRRKVAADTRHYPGLGEASDLESVAARLGVAMWELGKPELQYELAERRLGATSEPNPRAGIAELLRRGVLVLRGDRVAFFHQSFAEYAAACGLLKRPVEATVSMLLDRATQSPEDSYTVGVLEHFLLLVAEDPDAHAVVAPAVNRLLASSVERFRELALVALARQPGLPFDHAVFAQVPSDELFRLYRAVSFDKVDASALASLISVMWQQADPIWRHYGLFMLRDLAEFQPSMVFSFLEHHDVVNWALVDRSEGVWYVLYRMETILIQTALVDPEVGRLRILQYQASVPWDDPTDFLPGTKVLEGLREVWGQTGSVAYLHEITQATERLFRQAEPTWAAVYLDELGALCVAEWSVQGLPGGSWSQFCDQVIQEAEAEPESVEALSAMVGLGRVLAQMPAGDPGIAPTLDRLWGLQAPLRHWVAEAVFPKVLYARGAAADLLASRLLKLLRVPAPLRPPASEATPLERDAWMVRQVLLSELTPPVVTAEILARMGTTTAMWTDPQQLGRLAKKAAYGGNEHAQRVGGDTSG